jgi:hypothetical protein
MVGASRRSRRGVLLLSGRARGGRERGFIYIYAVRAQRGLALAAWHGGNGD